VEAGEQVRAGNQGEQHLGQQGGVVQGLNGQCGAASIEGRQHWLAQHFVELEELLEGEGQAGGS
jgi:hypothetical protein